MEPEFTIVTVCLNNKNGLERTINSVLATSRDIEYLIVDGGSTDGTLEFVRSLTDRRVQLFTGKDSGIYDAMNKGLSLAKGEVVGILNSGDTYTPTALQRVKEAFSCDEIDIVHGGMRFIESEREVVVSERGPILAGVTGQSPGVFINHPAFFVRRHVYEQLGGYDIKYKICADYHFMIRAFQAGYHFKEIDEYLVNFEMGGASDVRSFNRLYDRVVELAGVLMTTKQPKLKSTAFLMRYILGRSIRIAKDKCASTKLVE